MSKKFIQAFSAETKRCQIVNEICNVCGIVKSELNQAAGIQIFGLKTTLHVKLGLKKLIFGFTFHIWQGSG